MKDLALTRRQFDVPTSDRETVDLTRTATDDLRTVDGRDNLAQAVINRLLTRQGELAALGHPRYGSRLHELIGEPNNVRIRGKAARLVRECLEQERRIAKVTEIAFADPDRGEARSTLKIRISFLPVLETQETTITIPIVL